MTSKRIYHDSNVKSIEEQTLSVTNGVINKSETILTKSVENLEMIAVENEEISSNFIRDVGDAIRTKNKENILRMKDIMTKTIRNIEEEITSFGKVIEESVEGIMEYMSSEVKNIAHRVSLANSTTVQNVLSIALSDFEYSVTGSYVDLDNMYSFFDDYVLRFVNDRAVNGTRKISFLISSNRKYDPSFAERIRLCYNINDQNRKITDEINYSLDVTNAVLNCTQLIADIGSSLCGEYSTACGDHTHSLIHESQVIMNQEFFKTNNHLKTLMNQRRYFAGSKVSEDSKMAHDKIRMNILRHMKMCISNFAETVNVTMTDFVIVKDVHWSIMKKETDRAIENLNRALGAKLKLVEDPLIERQFKERLQFIELTSWMENKFKNNTARINTDFEKRKHYFLQELKDNIVFINENLVPIMSILSIENYTPNDECPLCVDYQDFIKSILTNYLEESCTKSTYQEHVECSRQNLPGLPLDPSALPELPFEKIFITEIY